MVVDNTNFTNISTVNGLIGLELVSSSLNIFDNITAKSNTGIDVIVDGDNNTFKNSYLDELYLGNSETSNEIFNNIFNGSVTFHASVGANYWNITNQTGTNKFNASIPYIGGNYWTNSTNNDYSDTCNDVDGDGYCDDIYDVYNDSTCTIGVDCSANVDYLPLSRNYSEVTDTVAPKIFQQWNQWNTGRNFCRTTVGMG